MCLLWFIAILCFECCRLQFIFSLERARDMRIISLRREEKKIQNGLVLQFNFDQLTIKMRIALLA
jgi:hypothetical protein